jgi:hypothetical protein
MELHTKNMLAKGAYSLVIRDTDAIPAGRGRFMETDCPHYPWCVRQTNKPPLSNTPLAEVGLAGKQPRRY